MIAYITRSPDDVAPKVSSWSIIMSNWFERQKEKREQFDITSARKSKSASLAPGELLSAHPSNFAIRYCDIAAIQFKSSPFEHRLFFHLSEQHKGWMRVDFILRKEQVIVARDLLKKVLPAKIAEADKVDHPQSR